MNAATTLEPGTFKLYADPGHTPVVDCDLYTSLTLSNEANAKDANGEPTATLRGALSGFCRIAVVANERKVALRFAHTSCGSKIFEGTVRNGDRLEQITVTDHRTRLCRDIVEARIIVDVKSNGSTSRLYSYDPPPPVPTWLTYTPTQCGTNPWNGLKPLPGQEGSFLQGEAAEVDNFFKASGIAVDQIGFAHPAEPMFVCASCSCPRGDTLLVHAKSPADARRLVTEHGFAPMLGAVMQAPAQCGTNPWQGGNKSGSEEQALVTWAETVGAPITSVGFMEPTEPMITCMACDCPRGDLAVVFPRDAIAASKLQDGFGWAQPTE